MRRLVGDDKVNGGTNEGKFETMPAGNHDSEAPLEVLSHLIRWKSSKYRVILGHCNLNNPSTSNPSTYVYLPKGEDLMLEKQIWLDLSESNPPSRL
jgi:hypothetical protein